MLFTAFIKVMAITTVSLSKSKHYFSARLSMLALDNLDLGPRAAEEGAIPPLCHQQNLLSTACSHAPVLSACWCVCVYFCVCVSDYGLEYDFKCAFYQPSSSYCPRMAGLKHTRGRQMWAQNTNFPPYIKRIDWVEKLACLSLSSL